MHIKNLNMIYLFSYPSHTQKEIYISHILHTGLCSLKKCLAKAASFSKIYTHLLQSLILSDSSTTSTIENSTEPKLALLMEGK